MDSIVIIDEVIEEAFFEQNFDYEPDANLSNAKKAVDIFICNYIKAKEIAELAENGEYFDECEATLAFQSIALAKKYFDQFAETIPEEERKVLQTAIDQEVLS